ncbi:GntR family transcriptional regulator [Pseudonocardia sp. RS11V-5]|uniref:GntR family transcriptional regulator n=1 Tax=Pseudonocardia terrae TaxID=2905831 RepID=UPI001E2CB4EB|nr:GntR family transcriptional regulator [Pseudonocardia terrae]MCE3552574.1 GntR family transcriptional regulator [Pseudonocardia terrae]
MTGGGLPERALSHALGVSRNTVREALSQLVAERVLVRVAGADQHFHRALVGLAGSIRLDQQAQIRAAFANR